MDNKVNDTNSTKSLCVSYKNKLKSTIKKSLGVLIILGSSLFATTSCNSEEKGYQVNNDLDTSKKVSITIAGSWVSNMGLDLLIDDFNKIYPNCTVSYEYLQDYNNTLSKRITSETDRIDIFNTSNITSTSANREFSSDLLDYKDQLPLTDTLPSLVDNYKFTENGTEHLYSVPLGGELRGLFVNKTLLNKLNIEVPKTKSEFLAACAKLKEANYIPIQHNPGVLGQRLLWPYCANLASKAHDVLDDCKVGSEEVFKDAYQFMYDLTTDYYYDYKTVETETGRYKSLTSEAIARDFLNIVEVDGTYQKKDDIGEVAFMPDSDNLIPNVEKEKENYDSKIEYEFMIAPVTEDGGYAYISPNNGFAINKNSYNHEWAVEFLNFFFTAQKNKIYAEAMKISPNTLDAPKMISEKYSIPLENIGDPELVRFDKYNLYNVVNPTLVKVSKANNPKYMQENGEFYSFDYYMNLLKEAFDAQRAQLAA